MRCIPVSQRLGDSSEIISEENPGKKYLFNTAKIIIITIIIFVPMAVWVTKFLLIPKTEKEKEENVFKRVKQFHYCYMKGSSCESKIRELDVSIFVNQYVIWFDVSVHNSKPNA